MCRARHIHRGFYPVGSSTGPIGLSGCPSICSSPGHDRDQLYTCIAITVVLRPLLAMQRRPSQALLRRVSRQHWDHSHITAYARASTPQRSHRTPRQHRSSSPAHSMPTHARSALSPCRRALRSASFAPQRAEGPARLPRTAFLSVASRLAGVHESAVSTHGTASDRLV